MVENGIARTVAIGTPGTVIHAEVPLPEGATLRDLEEAGVPLLTLSGCTDVEALQAWERLLEGDGVAWRGGKQLLVLPLGQGFETVTVRVVLPSPDDPAAVEFFAERMHGALSAEQIAAGYADHALAVRRAQEPTTMTEAAYGERWYCCDLPPHKHARDLGAWEELPEDARESRRRAAKEFLEALREWPAQGASDA